MKFLKNKHVILAMFIAPALAIMSYLATDHLVSEKPHGAVEGGRYPLAAGSNCRYESGQCTLENGDIEIQIQAERMDDSKVVLTATSRLPIQNAVIAYVRKGREENLRRMRNTDAEDTTWRVQLDIPDPANSGLRLAFTIAGAVYYVETPAVFIDYKTAFKRDNFSS